MSSPRPIDVLVDMTAMDTPSRHRGIGRYVANLCEALVPAAADAGLSVAGLTRHAPSWISQAGRKPSTERAAQSAAARAAIDEKLAFPGTPNLSITSLGYQRHKLERRLFLGTMAHKSGARLLHLPDPPGTPLDMRLRRVITCHDLIPLILHRQYLKAPGQRLLQRARDWARYCTAERIIADSESTKRDLIAYLSVKPSRIDVVYLGVDHSRFHTDPLPNEKQRVADLVGTSGPFALHVGAGDARKGLDLLVNAYPKTAAGRAIPLVVVGALSEKRQQLLGAAAVAANVDLRMFGFVDDEMIPALYRQCHLHVFPSAYEGFGLPVLEALACGAPTITMDNSSLPEVSGDGALLVSNRNDAELAAAIDKVAADDALRGGMRERGIQHARTFTWARCAKQTVDVYRKILAS